MGHRHLVTLHSSSKYAGHDSWFCCLPASCAQENVNAILGFKKAVTFSIDQERASDPIAWRKSTSTICYYGVGIEKDRLKTLLCNQLLLVI
jgi:hypothetical protein